MTGAEQAELEETVSAADAIGWLHEEGLARLAALGGDSGHPTVAFAVDVATGIITKYPAANGGIGADSSTVGADDLPGPLETARRLVIVGITSNEQLLVVDLAGSLMIGINGDRPELAARSWVCQLLLNPEVTITTNSSEVALGGGSRCRKSFIPGGGGSIVSVDDGRPPVTTVSMNSEVEGADYLELLGDGTGEMYLGARVWQLRMVLTIADAPWSVLSETLAESA
ncbi:hypothetical protein [Nocardia carnea]|uniref:hypothetical protein n=1 Tax=Nocardia carnea TaxID=37328 RepID=UPI002457C4A0|nr:hypothetical protein [Nocardia carnea]